MRYRKLSPSFFLPRQPLSGVPDVKNDDLAVFDGIKIEGACCVRYSIALMNAQAAAAV